ncbi:DNA-binding response OmpR family regulator [Bacillus velezensis]|nr:DNA-binding response OmpR family regulator [Bacillus velezensis]
MNKIMIVEDSEDIRGLLQNYLEKYGYQTVAAADFTAVLDVFLREKPDVVLLDINLPSYDGYYWCPPDPPAFYKPDHFHLSQKRGNGSSDGD